MKEKKEYILYNNIKYKRIPVKTHVIMKGEDIVSVVEQYTKDIVKEGDIIFISEKAVAASQGRAYPVSEIKPSKLAIFLSKYVTKSNRGIGLGIPETMELAIRECGVIRILVAAFFSFITKLFGIRGVFYIIAGRKASSIDGPTQNTIPPYNNYAVLGPKDPDKVCKKIAERLKVPVIIIDANDYGVEILGRSDRKLNIKFLKTVLSDNPLGQDREQTPIGIIRSID